MKGKKLNSVSYKVETNGIPDLKKIPKNAWDLLVKKILEDMIEYYQEKKKKG